MVRFVYARHLAAVVCLIGLSIVPAVAQEDAVSPHEAAVAAAPITLIATANQVPIPSLPGATAANSVAVAQQAAKRPSTLVPMYVTFAGLQALDIQSTYRALRNPDAVEANPVARAIVGNHAAFTAVKLAAVGGFVLASERMWKKHPLAAILFNVAGNSAMALVVTHNYRIPQQ